jgi:DNA-binding GntR family transcriptional regulator
MHDAGLRMSEALESQDSRAYFEADATFHRLLLEGTDNAVIAQLADTIGAVLQVRRNDTRPGMHELSLESVSRHLELAQALIERNQERAQAAALLLVEATLHEFESLLP